MFKPAAKFRRIEEAILNSVIEVLPPTARGRYLQQLALINSIERSANDKDVTFYIKKNWFKVAPLSDEVKFSCPDGGEGFRLARIILKNADTQFASKAYLHVVTGQIFEIGFNHSPKQLTPHFEIVSVELLQDPMAPALTLDPIIDARLPDDYSQLLATQQEKINGWRVLPPFQVRSVINESGNFYIVAERSGRYFLAIREEDDSGSLYLSDSECCEWEMVELGGISLRRCCGLYPD